MFWRKLPYIAEAVVVRPHTEVQGDDLPLDLGDEMFIIEQGGVTGDWFRGYLNQQPSLLSGLTPLREGQGLEQRVFTGTFPRNCVEIKGFQFADDEGEGENYGDRDSRDSLGQITSTDKAQKEAELTKMLLQQIETNTLPVPEPNPHDEKPQAPVPHLKAVDDDSSNSAEPLNEEIKSCLKEWHSNHIHKLILAGNYKDLNTILRYVRKLDFMRRQLEHGVLTDAELAKVRERAIWQMNHGNKILNGESVVRSDKKLGKLMDSSDSPIELSSMQAKMSLLNEVPTLHVAEKTMTLNHVLMDVKDIVNTAHERTTLKFSLVTKAKNGQPETLTECFSVDCKQGSLEDLTLKTRTATLFADLTAADVGDTPGGDITTYLLIKADRSHVPIPLKPWEGRESASMSRESLATPFHAANLGSINAGKSPNRHSMLGSGFGTLKGVFKSPSKKSPSKLNTLQEVFEPPTTVETMSRLSTSSSVTPPGTPGKAVSRTVAIGVLNLTKLFKEADGEQHAKVQLWIPSPAFDGNPQNKGSDWDEIVRYFLASPIGSYRRMPTMDKINMVIKPYIAEDSASLIRNKPTELSGVIPTAKLGFSGAPTKPRNDVYVTIDKANFPEKALLSRATGSATGLSQRPDFKNMQVRFEVHNKNGVKLENVIYASSNGVALTSYDTTVIEKNNRWNETIRLAIKPEDTQGAHLVMWTSDAPGYLFAVCHMPLWQDNAFVRDGSHDLLQYKNDDGASRAVSETTNKWHLNVKWSARGPDDTRKDEALTGPLSTLRIKTYLCSTIMSQDKVILGLLNWKSQEQAEVVNHLKQLLFCPEIEVVKQLNDVLDSLFAILVEHSENETFEDLTFTALVHVLNMAFDRRFNLSPLVDKYADEKFSFPFATPCLVRSFVRLLLATDPESSTKLRGTFKVTKHILKFINRGRSQMLGKEADIGITNGSNGFSNQISSLLNGLNSLMGSSEPRLIANQTIAAQHFDKWLPELEGMLSHDQVVHCAIDFIDAMADVKGKLKMYKLLLIIKYSELRIFVKDKSALVHNTVRWIKPYYGAIDGQMSPQYRDQVRLCCTVLATQINGLGILTEDHLPHVIGSYLELLNSPRPLRTTNVSLLFPRVYPFPVKPTDNKDDEFDEARIELSAIFSAISRGEQGLQLDNIADNKEDLANLVYNTLKMQGSILNAEAFPKTWLSLYVYHHKSAMGTLNQVATVLRESFLPAVEELSDEVVFLDELWKLLFQTLLKLITSQTLALENFADQKRRAVYTIGGDVRKEGAKLLGEMWHAIGWETDQDEQIRFGLMRMGGFQVQYVPALVPDTLVMCMHVHEDLCATGTEMLKSMIASEWQLNGSVAGVKEVIIDCLDKVFRTNSFTEGTVQKGFVEDLIRHFNSRFIPDEDPMRVQITEMLWSIEDFLNLLVAEHASGTTDEAGQLTNRLALMEFLRDMNKTETFIAYAHQLAGGQAAAGNFTEAGLAIRFHAEIYSWDPTKILPPTTDPPYPSQTEFERKESLYHEMIERFEEGESWGMVLEGYKELANQYAENNFDYKKLGRTYRAIGNVYEKIAKPDRLLTRYFHICFGGLGFFEELSMNQYINEGKPGMELAAFKDKIQEDYPEAQIVQKVEDFQEQEGQYISVEVCTPDREMSDLVNQRTKVPNVVKEYLATRHPQAFTIPKKKVFAGPVEEHYMDQIVLYTEEAFPTISRRSPIVSADLKRLDAVETAIYRVQRTNKMLATLEKLWFVNHNVEKYTVLVELLKQEVDTSVNKKAVIATRALLPSAKVQELNEDEGNMSQYDQRQTSVGGLNAVELNDHQKALKTALVDEAIIINRILSNFALSDAPVVVTQGAELRPRFEKSFDVELASIAPKAVVKVEDYQRPWNFQVATNGDSQHTASPVKDNRASNLSTLGPLPSMAQKPAMHKSRTSSSMTSTDSSLSSKAEKTPNALRRTGSFLKQAFGKDEKDSDAASGKENQKPGKKTKRGPPVAFKGAKNGNSDAKSMKGRDSDAGSTKSSRKSIGSFSRHSFFGRNRANSNATEAVIDDGNSEWTDTNSSRFVSNSTDASRGIFTGRNNDRYISDSIHRGGPSETLSLANSMFSNEPISLNNANLSQEQQVEGGAVPRMRSDSVSTINTVSEASDVESPSKDSEAGYNYDTIRPVKPRSYLSPEKNVDLSGDFSAPGFTGVLAIPRSRPRPASKLVLPTTFNVQSDARSYDSFLDWSDPDFDVSNLSSDVKSITTDAIREEQARLRSAMGAPLLSPTGGTLDDAAIRPAPGPMAPLSRPRRSTVSSIGSLGSGMTNFDPNDVPVRVVPQSTRLATLTEAEAEAATRRAELREHQELLNRELIERNLREQESAKRAQAEFDAFAEDQKRMKRAQDAQLEAERERARVYEEELQVDFDWGQPQQQQQEQYVVPPMNPRYRPDDNVDWSPRFNVNHNQGYNVEDNQGYNPEFNPNQSLSLDASQAGDDAFGDDLFRVIPHNPQSCLDANCGQQLCEEWAGPDGVSGLIVNEWLEQDDDGQGAVGEQVNSTVGDAQLGSPPHEPSVSESVEEFPSYVEGMQEPLHAMPNPYQQPMMGPTNAYGLPIYGVPSPFMPPHGQPVGHVHPMGYETMHTQQSRFAGPPIPYGPPSMHPGYQTMGPHQGPFGPPPMPYGPPPVHPGYQTMGPQQGPFGPPPLMHSMGHQTMGPQHNPFIPPPMGMGPYGPPINPMHPMGHQTLPPMRPPPGLGFSGAYPHQPQMASPYMPGGPFNTMQGPPPGFASMGPPPGHPMHFQRHGPTFQQHEPQGMGAASPRYGHGPPASMRSNLLQHLFQPSQPEGSPMVSPPGPAFQQVPGGRGQVGTSWKWTKTPIPAPANGHPHAHPLQQMFQPPPPPTFAAQGPQPGEIPGLLVYKTDMYGRRILTAPSDFERKEAARKMLKEMVEADSMRRLPKTEGSIRMTKTRTLQSIAVGEAFDSAFDGSPLGPLLPPREPSLMIPPQLENLFKEYKAGTYRNTYKGPIPGAGLKLPPLGQSNRAPMNPLSGWKKSSQPHQSVQNLEKVFDPPTPEQAPMSPDHPPSWSPLSLEKETPGAPRMRNATPVVMQMGGSLRLPHQALGYGLCSLLEHNSPLVQPPVMRVVSNYQSPQVESEKTEEDQGDEA